MIHLVRKRANRGKVRVVVPDYAKSAATLVALGADQIVMSDASELGAVDPQVSLTKPDGTHAIHSAQNYIDAYKRWTKVLRKDPTDPVARLMLEHIDPVTLRTLKRTVRRSRTIAEELLLEGMLKGNPTVAHQAAQDLSDTKKWQSHGQMIGQEQCARLGLDVAYLHPDSDLWQEFWSVYCLQTYSISAGTKLFESNIASLNL